MELIGDLLSRDLSQVIEEIIQVDQLDEQTVYSEITEYVATDRIKDHYRSLLKAIAEAPSEPHEGVGIWISGFFGSGKSSFAKNLGYLLANPSILGNSYSDLFKNQLKDRRTSELVDFINKGFPTEVIMFDISKAKEVKRGDEKIAEVIYRRLLSHLDYAEDYDIAELEIELESDGRLDEFGGLCSEVNGKEWSAARKGAMKINYASAILHKMNPETFPQADSWAKSLQGKHPTITVELVVDRAFELTARRRPGKALFFIIDEVGQYVARSVDRIEDLRAVVEQFGKVSKNRLKAKKSIAPSWIAVTSQEKLEEVVAALDSKRVELAKLQDRFKYRVDLAPADIREVASRRVLAKKDDALPVLNSLFDRAQGQLNLGCRLERTSRRSEVLEEEFIQSYPYLPHFIDMSIDIMSGIRLQPGADKHLGGSNRTIIKQAHEMLVNERTALKDKPVGALVTLDKIFDLVEGNISTEKRKDIDDIRRGFKTESEWALRVAKAICLLEFIRDLPRTDSNIAACLVDEVSRPAPLADVKTALHLLQEAKFVRDSEDGWKLQTAEEKSWETERRSLEPKPRDRRDMLNEAVSGMFGDLGLKSYRFGKLKTFKVGVSYNGDKVEDGQISLSIISSDDESAFQAKKEEIRAKSRQESHRNEIFFVFPLNAEIDALVADLHSSKEMVKKYDHLRAQNKIAGEQAALLETEKKEVSRKRARLQESVALAFMSGASMFRGSSKDGSDLGKSLENAIKNLLDDVVLDLYPRLPMWARPLKGNEAEELLKAANLSGLAAIFYNSEQGMNLVVREGQKFVINSQVEVAKEVLDHLAREHEYGSRETRTGKALEAHFGGLGYGGDQDMLRMVLAVLFRGGAIEVSFGGQRFDSYQDPASHEAFTNSRTFRSALFTPATVIDIRTLTSAVERFEEITGGTVDVDKNAIASAFKQFAEKELRGLLPVEERIRANGLPGLDRFEKVKEILQQARRGTAEGVVGTLAGEGRSLKESLDGVHRIREIMNDEAIRSVKRARLALKEMWPILKVRLEDDDEIKIKDMAGELDALLSSGDLYDKLGEMKRASLEISGRYLQIFTNLHDSRRNAFQAAIEEIKLTPDWASIKESMRGPILRELTARGCEDLQIAQNSVYCSRCRASIPQMESDSRALADIKTSALQRMAELLQTAGEQKRVERVRLSRVYKGKIDSKESVDKAVEALREHLMKLLLENASIILE
ncbi:MAG: BREX system P-loop protein BrxC [Methanotrichaceae archaeon]|nr:BREX system P-loop protein BrxC [Methanotrichaceae archaeon]